MWTTWFLKEQGYVVKSNIFYQDNQSAILLEKNGSRSSGEKSRHINIRYFFIKDVLRRERISVTHCPTEHMIADYFTKPLLGSLFTHLRNVIMGITPHLTKERVGNKVCPGTEHENFNHSTTDTENVRKGEKGTTGTKKVHTREQGTGGDVVHA